MAAAQASPAAVIFVTNEVGCGLVPDNSVGRDFRDHAGILNQRIGSVADEVYWMVFGHPAARQVMRDDPGRDLLPDDYPRAR